ncbi:MAG: penicillin-binding transpeptidase domain-containing protein [Gammaproteobacteria bacterium]
MIERPSPMQSYPVRRHTVLLFFAAVLSVLVWRALDLQVLHRDFLQGQADARHLRVVSIPAIRGTITDRNGEPLAMSTPIDSVWANPQELISAREYLPRLAKVLELDRRVLERLVEERADREFVYLKRHVSPEQAAQAMALQAPGVALQREYKRFYPAGEVVAHVVGFTSVDDVGQEGLELAFDDWLQGKPGAKRVLKDGKGRIIQDVESICEPRPGRDLALSIDRRVQYLAYRELKSAVLENRARGGSAVILDVQTGEVLAMVSQPSYNPNNRKDLNGSQYRNRAVTDVFEPGSAVKPFAVAIGLESGRYRPDTLIETTPGQYRLGRFTIKDIRNYGLIDVATVISKSSNVGSAKIALSLPAERLWDIYRRIGFGAGTGSGFPGEAAGLLRHYRQWREIDHATLSFGYGLSVTPLQLARAYAVLAGDGSRRPVSFLRLEEPPAGEPVVAPAIVAQLRSMLEAAVATGGTAAQAQVAGYRVAGKTGTVRKSGVGGYEENKYRSVFVGMVPASRPRLVMAIMIDEPRGEEYYGGLVAAPVFSKVMSGALRLLNIPPDDLPAAVQSRTDAQGKESA